MEEAYRLEVVRLIFGDVGRILSDFSCAVEAKVLLHGRMYITTRYICFYSNFFGYEKKIKLPYRSINCVTREKDKLFGSKAIEINTPKKNYAFRSFWDRDECYKILRDCHRAGIGEPPLPDSVLPALMEQARSKKKREPSASDEADDAPAKADAPASPAAAPAPRRPDPPSPARADPPEGAGGSADPDPTPLPDPGADPGAADPDPEPAGEPEPKPEGEPEGDPAGPSGEAKGAGVGEDRGEAMAKGAEEDIFDEEQSQAVPEGGLSDPERLSRALGERRMKHELFGCRFEGLGVQEFFDLFLSDGAELSLAAFHASRGDSELDCAAWASAEGGLELRALKFRTPVVAPIGPSSTRGVKVQRLRRFGASGLILDSSTNLEDIPNGDAFKVDDQWVVCPAEGGALDLRVHFECVFHKAVLWKGIIETRSKADTAKFYEDWAEAARRHLQERRNPRRRRDRRGRAAPGRGAARPPALPEVNVNPKFTIPVIPWLLAILFLTLYWRSQGEVALLRQTHGVARAGGATEAQRIARALDAIAERLERLEAKVDAYV